MARKTGVVRKGVYVPPRALPRRRLTRARAVVVRGATRVVQRLVRTKDWVIELRDDVWKAFITAYSSPVVLLSSVIMLVFVSNYLTTESLKSTKPYGVTYGTCMTIFGGNSSRCDNFASLAPKIAAPLLYTPAVFATPSGYKFIVSMLLCLWTTVVPESSVYQYLFQSAMLSLYLRVRKPLTKTLIVALVLVMYQVGFVFK